jgi:hypothetical protein
MKINMMERRHTESFPEVLPDYTPTAQVINVSDYATTDQLLQGGAITQKPTISTISERLVLIKSASRWRAN